VACVRGPHAGDVREGAGRGGAFGINFSLLVREDGAVFVVCERLDGILGSFEWDIRLQSVMIVAPAVVLTFAGATHPRHTLTRQLRHAIQLHKVPRTEKLSYYTMQMHL